MIYSGEDWPLTFLSNKMVIIAMQNWIAGEKMRGLELFKLQSNSQALKKIYV